MKYQKPVLWHTILWITIQKLVFLKAREPKLKRPRKATFKSFFGTLKPSKQEYQKCFISKRRLPFSQKYFWCSILLAKEIDHVFVQNQSKNAKNLTKKCLLKLKKLEH